MTNLVGYPPVALNPDLDLTGLHEQFQETGRLQIKDAFHTETATRLLTCLREETPWMLAYNQGDTPTYMTREQMSALPPDQQAGFMQQVFAGAANGFQYLYMDFPVAGTANVPDQPKFYTHEILKFLGSEPFLNVLRDLTGLGGEFLVDSHATCFQAGHFLTNHNDLVTRDDPREIAYVINMTPEWNTDWGAATMFFDEDGSVIETFAPIFNTITMFKVPQQHSVTFVPPFCPKQRFGMSGWFYRPEGIQRG